MLPKASVATGSLLFFFWRIFWWAHWNILILSGKIFFPNRLLDIGAGLSLESISSHLFSSHIILRNPPLESRNHKTWKGASFPTSHTMSFCISGLVSGRVWSELTLSVPLTWMGRLRSWVGITSVSIHDQLIMFGAINRTGAAEIGWN